MSSGNGSGITESRQPPGETPTRFPLGGRSGVQERTGPAPAQKVAPPHPKQPSWGRPLRAKAAHALVCAIETTAFSNNGHLESPRPTREFRPRHGESHSAGVAERSNAASSAQKLSGLVLPLELDFELALVALEFEFELDPKLIGDMDCYSHTVALELEVVVAVEHLREASQPRCDFLSPQLFVLLDLEDVH